MGLNQKELRHWHKETLIEIKSASSGSNTTYSELKCFCAETKTLYAWIQSGGSYTSNDQDILSTGVGGNTRWIGIAGKYTNSDYQFLVSSNTTVGTSITFYVGGTGASDTNDGLTALAPKQHLTFIENIYSSPATFNYSQINVIVQGDIPAITGERALYINGDTTTTIREIKTQLNISGIMTEYGGLGELSVTSVDKDLGVLTFSGTPLVGIDLSDKFFRITSGTGASTNYYPIHSNTDSTIKSVPINTGSSSSKIRIYSVPVVNSDKDTIGIYIQSARGTQLNLSNINFPDSIFCNYLKGLSITSVISKGTTTVFTDTHISSTRCLFETDNYCWVNITGAPDLTSFSADSCVWTSTNRVTPSKLGYGLYVTGVDLTFYTCLFFGQAVALTNDSGASAIKFYKDGVTGNLIENSDIGITPGVSLFFGLGNIIFKNNRIGVVCEGSTFRDYIGGTLKISSSIGNTYELVTAIQSDGTILDSETFAHYEAGTAVGNTKVGSSFSNLNINTFLPIAQVEYDNTTSGLSAIRYQSAIDELASTKPTTFLGLTDTPSSYATSANYFVRVNSGETGLEFIPKIQYETTNKIYYVRTTGSDTTGDGLTSVTAFLTINKAVNSLNEYLTAPSTAFITVTINVGVGTTTLNDHIYWEKLGRNVQVRFITEFTNIYDNYNVSDSSTFTSNSRNIHTDTSKTWSVDALVGYWVRVKTVKTGTMPTTVNVMVPIIRNGVDWVETTWTGSSSTYLVNQDWDNYDLCTHDKVTLDFNSKVFKVSTDSNYALTFVGFNMTNNTALIGSSKLHIGLTCCALGQSSTNFVENSSFVNCYVNTVSSLGTISVAFNTAFRSSLLGSGIINNTKVEQGMFQIAGCVFRSVSTKTASITGIIASEVPLKLSRNNKFINIYSPIKITREKLFLGAGDVEFDTCDFFLTSGISPCKNIIAIKELTTDVFTFYNEPTIGRLSFDNTNSATEYYNNDYYLNCLDIAPDQYKFIKFNTHENVDVDTGTEVVDTFSDTSGKAVRWDIVISKGTILRVCSINAVWDATTDAYNDSGEYGIVNIGDSSAITLSVDISSNYVRLLATTTTDDWIVTTQRYLI